MLQLSVTRVNFYLSGTFHKYGLEVLYVAQYHMTGLTFTNLNRRSAAWAELIFVPFFGPPAAGGRRCRSRRRDATSLSQPWLGQDNGFNTELFPCVVNKKNNNHKKYLNHLLDQRRPVDRQRNLLAFSNHFGFKKRWPLANELSRNTLPKYEGEILFNLY